MGSKPTIGVLPGWSAYEGDTPDRYLGLVFSGIQSAARVRGCNLLLAWDVGHLESSRSNPSSDVNNIRSHRQALPTWPVVAPDSDFVPVGPWNTDGLIVLAPLLNETRSLYLQEVSSQGHPVLFIALGENGPTIAADNADGIRQAVTHLVNHGHRRIAFIAGDPADPGDSAIRLAAYRAAIREYGLEDDQNLIHYGRHNLIGGYAALREILSSGVEFTAVLASDDVSAIGSMQALKEAGLKIPHDVAIIGFDDQPDAIAQVPPLASVHVPLTEIGYQALECMLDHIEEHTPLRSIKISTWLMPRQSCGCLPEAVLTASDSGSWLRPVYPHSSRKHIEYNPNIARQLVDEMITRIPESELRSDRDWAQRLCTRLVEAFATCLQNGNSTIFRSVLLETIQEIELVEGDIHTWQDIISVLRLKAALLPNTWSRSETRQQAEDMLHQFRVAISESVHREIWRHQYKEDATAYRLSMLTSRLSATLDERQAVDVLAEYLPKVGIRHASVILFQREGDDPVAWSTVVDTSSGIDPITRRFSSRTFPPPDLYPTDELLNIVLLPLVFQNEALGYVAFEASDLQACATIARQLAVTLKSARLHTQVVELSLTDSLTNLHNRRYFEIFLKSELERSRRFMRGLSIIMLDLDNLKYYNDNFGHPAGDEALQIMARCFQDELRKMDVVTRLGGDEFAFILPETGEDGAIEVSEKIRSKVAGLTSARMPLTISLGVAVLQGMEDEAENLVNKADLALYQAKRRGRNRVCVYRNQGEIVELKQPPV